MASRGKSDWPVFLSGREQDLNSPLGRWLSKNWIKLQRSDVKGSLRGCLPFWQEITSDPFILKVIGSGYEPEFLSVPPAFEKRNNVTARENYDFVLQSVVELLVNGFVQLTDHKPKVINQFSVSVQSNGKND